VNGVKRAKQRRGSVWSLMSLCQQMTDPRRRRQTQRTLETLTRAQSRLHVQKMQMTRLMRKRAFIALKIAGLLVKTLGGWTLVASANDEYRETQLVAFVLFSLFAH